MEKDENTEFDLSMETLHQLTHEMKADRMITISDNNKESDEWLEIDSLKVQDIKEQEEPGTYIIHIYQEDHKPITLHIHKSETRQFDGIIAEIVSELIKQGQVKQHMKLLLVADRSISKKYNTSIIAFDVNRVLYRIGKFDLAEHMSSETVIETIIEIAQEIAQEGREGKKIGTLFVIGEPKELEQYSQQLIMNPFHGYERELLNVVNNDTIRETIKNFAQLDGAFTINNDGELQTAGTYLDVDTSNIQPFQGWGTKHLAATAITQVTNSVAVLVSESGGAVKIFKNGKLILRLR